jgi:acetyl esterase/lipase
MHILGQQSYLTGGPAAIRVILTDSKNEAIAGQSSVNIDLVTPDSSPRVLFTGRLNGRGTTEAQFRFPAGLAGRYSLRYTVDTPIGSTEFTQQVRLGGFSAGGELVNLVCARFDEGKTGASDPIESQSCRPSFQALIYPGRSGDIQPVTNFPPVFLACSYTDRKDISEGLAEVYLRFKRAGVPAELHIYSTGGHGFGLRSSNKKPVGAWAARFEEWMADSGFLPKK